MPKKHRKPKMHSLVYTSRPFVQRNANFLKYWPKLFTTCDGLEAQNLVMTLGGHKKPKYPWRPDKSIKPCQNPKICPRQNGHPKV